MNVGGLIAGILMLLAAVAVGPRLCGKVWRDPAYADMITRGGRVLPFSYATSRGVTRGMIGLWTGVGFIGAGTIAVALMPAAPHTSNPALITAVALYGLGLIGIALNVSIVWFSRPRVLVPPHMRGEDGLFTTWWRERDLPPAQRRAAARARRNWPPPEPKARSGQTQPRR